MGITRQLWIRALSPTGRVVGVASYDSGLSAHKHKRPALNLVYAGREVEPRFPVSGFYQTEVNLSTPSIFHTSYDLAGRIDYINDSVSGIIDYTYNDFGCTACGGRGMDRIAQEVTPLGTIDYTYDGVGRRTTMQVLGQPIVNYDYYNNGWLENVRQVVNSVEQKFNFVYDNGGRRERLKSFNGASLITETVYGFDNANRLLEMKHLNSLNIELEVLNYLYDANGNRTNMNRPSVNLPLPNSVSNTSYNEANQMLSFNDKNIIYDENGNMISSTNSCGTTTYTWDVRNRLIAINGFNSDCSSLTASFKYDTLNRRIEKTINGLTTKYLYDGLDIIQELNQDGSVKANYIRGLNIDEPLLRITQNSVRFYMTDALGSVIALTDENGVVKTIYTYDPFGNASMSGEATDNPFQYTGRENDGTGHLFERNRYYSYELLRYISEDPVRLAGGDTNYYVRVGNNPVNFVDPLGLWGIGIIGSESTELGLVAIGAGQTGSIGGGFFTQGFFKNPNLGGFASWGGFAGGPGYGPSYPSGNSGNVVGGAYAGIGAGVFVTNAKCAEDLKGPFKTYSLNVGIGPVKVTVQISYGNGTWIGSVGPPIPYTGAGIGISGSGYKTNTWTTRR